MGFPESTRKFMNKFDMPIPDDLSRFKNMIEDLGLCFNKSLRSDVIEAYAREVSSKLTLEEAFESTKKLKMNSKFFPTVGDIINNSPGSAKDRYEPKLCSRCGISGAIVEKFWAKNGKTDLEYQRMWQCPCPNGLKLMAGLVRHPTG